MSYGPPPIEEVIFKKTKEWWNNLKKIHIPEERSKYTPKQLIELVKQTQRLKMEIQNIQLQVNLSLKKTIDFKKLTMAFYREFGYYFGVPIDRSKLQK